MSASLLVPTCCVLLTMISFPLVCDGGGYCSFPPFLWQPHDDGTPRRWISRTEYFDASDTWEKQKHITAQETEITMQHKVHASCHGYRLDDKVPCFRQNIIYNIICISEEPDGKFRVQQQSQGKFHFTCLKFIRRNENIVQVYSAVPNEINEDRLCYDSALHREEWPWINPHKTNWEFCPFSGGFDFSAYLNNDRERWCPEEWRPARMESECILGESLNFYFYRDSCSPFRVGRKQQRLQCWGHWKEGNFMVLMLGEDNNLPRYVLRLPVDMQSRGTQFSGYLYFSPVVPMSGRGNPPGRVMYMELRMIHSGKGLCYDASDDCPDFAQQGKCTNSALHQYANYCMKSCGLCDLAPSEKAECHFSPEFIGSWATFDEEERAEITISSHNVTFSNLGTFICKSKHWSMDYYKVLSTYTNGCRPRYSCLHLMEASDSVLQYRLSHSRLSDESFSVCEFHDDPKPLGGQIRSGSMKNILPLSNLQFGSCGVGGIVHVNATFSDGRSCDGVLTDVDDATCRVKHHMSLSLQKCHIAQTEGFVCVAYAYLPRGTGFLVTQMTDHASKYTCWVVKADVGRKAGRPWREVFQLNRARCSTGEILPLSTPDNTVVSIRTYNDHIERGCGRFHHEPFQLFKKFLESDDKYRLPTIPPSTTLSYWLKETTFSTTRTTSLVKRTRKQDRRVSGESLPLGEVTSCAATLGFNTNYLTSTTMVLATSCVFIRTLHLWQWILNS